MQWIQVAQAAEIPQRQVRVFQVAGHRIAIFHIGDEFLAVENECPQSGCSLAEGALGGTTVTCPVHQWRVCLRTGLVTKPVVEGTPQVKTYPVKIEQGIILLGMRSQKVAA